LPNIKTTFQENIKRYHALHETLNKKDNSLSAIRIILFLVSIALIVYGANDRNGLLIAIVLIVFLVVFGLLIKYHNGIKFKNKTAHYLEKINVEELQRSSGDFQALNKGDEFIDKNHAFAPDLDVFGSNSLFQLISRSRLLLTQKLTANWLLNLADKTTIIERQGAIKELSTKTEWRQSFTAYGMHAELGQSNDQITAFGKWMEDRNDFIEKYFWKIITWIMPAFSLFAILGIIFFSLPYQVIFIPIIINVFLLKVTFEPLLKLTKDFNMATRSLKVYEYLFSSIEAASFESEKLNALKNQIGNENGKASILVKQLRRILDQLDNRANMLYGVVNILFALDIIWLRQAESWKRKNAEASEKWFSAVHEFDLLGDMASFTFANPNYTFPEIIEENFKIKAEALGHPLIKETARINNTFEFVGSGFVGLITGSNMSGKSTFLRTVGLNLAMAQMGLPVCANSFSFSLTRIFTGMRTTDNLEESVSSFYAELARIKSLLDSINNEVPIFYLLDEILKGTNSDDRHKGSISLIKQLNQKNAFGLVSTHDLTLSAMEKDNELIKNFSFNSTIDANEILFDYKLTDGPCRSFNASKLMEKMGIIVN
jgi:DNA mismatch repair ATPase MutS